MKNFIKLITISCLIICCILVFIACGEKHEHTYSTDWSSDESYHWHDATCEHTSEQSDKMEHSFGEVITDRTPTGTANGKGHKVCSICGKSVDVDIDSWSPKGKSFIFSKFLVVASNSTAEDWLRAKTEADKKDMTNEQFAKWMIENYNSLLSEASTYTFDANELVVTQVATVSLGLDKNKTMSESYSYSIEDNEIIINNCVAVHIINGNTINIEETAKYNISIQSQYIIEGTVAPDPDPIPNLVHEHNYGTWIAEIPATCETAGTLGHYHCEGCNTDFDAEYKEISSLVIEAKGHKYQTEWSSDETKHWYASSCGCDVKKDEATHTFNNKGVCTVCGYDSCSILSLGYTFDDDNSKGTENAEQNTKWYAKVSLTNETTYMASCTNINKYIIKIYDKDGTQIYEFSSESNYFYKFNATYTGDYYISILKSGSGNYKPMFYIASVQNMTSPFDSASASNSATYSAREFKVFSFTIAADCSIKLNGAFGEDDWEEFISSNMETIYMTSWDTVNHFQTIEDLPAGTYYFVDYSATAGATVNYYLVCGHNFGDNGICDVCGYTCTHTSKNVYDICDTCGQFFGHTDVVANGDSVYPDTSDGDVVYRFELTAGTYKIIEELGTDCTGYNYYLFVEGASDTEYLNKGADTKTITIIEGGVYYLVVEDEHLDYDNGGNSFQLLEDLTSNLIANGSYTATSIADDNTYYYIIDITTAGVYTFTYDEDIDGDVVDGISIVGQTAIDGSTDYKLAVGRYILQVEAGTVVGGDILINCVYSQCIVTDGSLTQGLTVAHGGKVYFQINLEEGDYSVREGSTLDIAIVFKLGGVIVGSSDNFSIDEELGADTYYVVAYNDGDDTTTGAFGIQ